MTALLLLVQAFFNHQTQVQTQNLREAGLRAAEKGRRFAVAGAFMLTAGVFLFSGLIMALIEMGLQIDRGQGVGYSGLMISATILAGMGLFCIFLGWVLSREAEAATPAHSEPATAARSELRESLESIAVLLINEYRESRKTARNERQE